MVKFLFVLLFVLVITILSIKIVRKAGVHILQILTIIILTAISSFLLGGWYFQQSGGADIVDDLKKDLKDPSVFGKKIKKALEK